MNPEKILKKLLLQKRITPEGGKKPLVSPVVRHLENERRSRSPLFKDISMLSKKSLQKELENTRKRQLNSLISAAYKSRNLSAVYKGRASPTPTLSRKKMAPSRTSVSKLEKTSSKVNSRSPIKDRPFLLQTKTEKRNASPLPENDFRKRVKNYTSQKKFISGGEKTQSNFINQSQIVQDHTSREFQTYLDQRRAEHRHQKSGSKGKKDNSETNNQKNLNSIGLDVSDSKGSLSRTINRTLKYDEQKISSSPRQNFEQKNGKKTSPRNSSNKNSDRGSSTKKKIEGSEFIEKTSNFKAPIDDITKKQSNQNERYFQEVFTETNYLKDSHQKSPNKNLQEERSQRRVERVEFSQKANPAGKDEPQKSLVDSLELEHASLDAKKRGGEMVKNLRTAEMKSGGEGPLKVYETTNSDLSFSGHKPDFEPADTPKFDSGIQQMDTGSMPNTGSTQKETERLCMIFKKIIVFYERIEELKNQLYNDKEFRLCDHFWAFDFENKGYLTLNEFTQLFNSFQINIGKGEIVEYLKIILKRPIITHHSRLTEQDIAKCFAPINPEGKLMLYCSHASGHENLPKYEIRPAISRLLDEVVQLQIKMHCEIIKECKLLSPASQKRLFFTITRTGLATWPDVIRFMKENEVKFYEEDVIFIFREFSCRHSKAMTESEFLAFFRLYSTAGL